MKPNIIHFDKYSRKKESERKALVLKLEVYKLDDTIDYAYTLKKGKVKKSDDFIAFSLAYVIEDILRYNADPCDILELTEEMIQRLGYEHRSTSEDEL